MTMLGEWLNLLRREFGGYNRSTFQKDLLAGLTVAAVALPLALAFGVASGADAAAGLVTAIIAGIVIGALSGSPFQVSGPTGAMSAVLIVLAARQGLQGVWLAGGLAGVMMIILGITRLGRVVALIPSPVISGFTSGIAVIIALGQIDNILGIKTPTAESVIDKLRYYADHSINPDTSALLIGLAVVAVMLLWPRLGIARQIPASLVGIILATVIVWATALEVPTIGSIPRGFLLENRFSLSQVAWSDLSVVVVPAMSIAALGTIESLLCGAVAGNMTGIRMHNSIELIGQGVGNVIIPFFGGVPATAAIARTSVNVKSGAVTRLSSIIHGVVLLGTALALAPLIEKVPLAALAGVLMVTAWRMNEWHAIHFFFGKRLKHAVLAYTITLAATVLLDLTQAIVIGFGISSLIFMAQMSDLHVSRQPVDIERMASAGHRFVAPDQPIVVYYVSGPLFFAASRKLLEHAEQHDPPASTIILSLRGVPLVDATGVEVLRELLQRQMKGGGKLLLASLQPRVEKLLERMDFLRDLGSENIFWSSDRAILSLGLELPDGPAEETEHTTVLDNALTLTPHEERSQQKI